MSGILRTHGKPKAKARALIATEMIQIYEYLNHAGSFTALRDNALLQVGFFGALRRSELVAICLEHISWKNAGIEILIPSSKTDQNHEGQYCAIPRAPHESCPVHALEIWIEAAPIKSGAIFRRIMPDENISTGALTPPQSVNHILKQRADEAGFFDKENLSSHSLRRGLATSAAQAGAPLHSIMRAGRWKQTNTVMEYIEENERFEINAASIILNKGFA